MSEPHQVQRPVVYVLDDQYKNKTNSITTNQNRNTNKPPLPKVKSKYQESTGKNAQSNQGQRTANNLKKLIEKQKQDQSSKSILSKISNANLSTQSSSKKLDVDISSIPNTMSVGSHQTNKSPSV
jgi:hypothetical protein